LIYGEINKIKNKSYRLIEMGKLLILISALILMFTGFLITSTSGSSLGNENPETGYVCINNRCFTVELATTQSERQYGLMNRKSLDLDKGMLFIFEDEGDHHFWMKNTLIPLDIIWINSSQNVVYIHKNAQPCNSYYCPSIDPGKNARYVLEINGGLSDKYNMSIGDKANISYVSSSNSRNDFLTKKYPGFAHTFPRLISSSTVF
jgi:uncharacterized membrane protein (UPF0127 family)